MYDQEIFFNDDFNWQEAFFGIKNKKINKDIETKLIWKPENVKEVYNLNSFDFRSDEFVENRDLIFTGCSHTFGQGTLNDGIWGNIVSKELNLKSYNLGSPGSSTQDIVSVLFDYFREIGNPKIVLCLFPDFIRMNMWSDISEFKSKHFSKQDKGKRKYSLLLDNYEYAKISKIPHDVEFITPRELAFALSLQYIKMLEAYCKANKILLLWGTWDPIQENYIDRNRYNLIFENFIYLENQKWHQRKQDGRKVLYHENMQDKCDFHEGVSCNIYTKCHEDQRKIYGKNFDLAMDCGDENLMNGFGHWGVHKHIHIAEKFIKILERHSIV
jgi:hypothetical protein